MEAIEDNTDGRVPVDQSVTGLSSMKIGMIVYGVLTGVFGLLMLQFVRFPIWTPVVILVVVFGLSMWVKRDWVLLMALAVVLVVRFGNPNLFYGMRSNLVPGDGLFVMVVLGYIAFGFRYLECAKFELTLVEGSNPEAAGEFWPMLTGRWLLIPLAIFGAMVFLGVVGDGASMGRRVWMTPTATRLTMVVFILFFAWLIFRGLFSMTRRWKMTGEQGSVLFRSQFAKEFWREHKGIERRRVKWRIRSRK